MPGAVLGSESRLDRCFTVRPDTPVPMAGGRDTERVKSREAEGRHGGA